MINDVAIEFTEIAVKSDGMLIAHFDVTSNRTESITNPLQSDCEGRYFSKDSGGVKFTGTHDWCSTIEAGQTIQDQVSLCHIEDAQETIEAYGAVYGVTWFNLGGKQYYVDLSDYFIK